MHALAIESVAERFDEATLETLSAETHGKWRMLIGKHAAVVADQLERLREALEPALSLRVATNLDGDETADATLGVGAAARELGGDVVRIDDAMRGALAASSEPPGEIRLRDPGFWRALRQTESLARTLAR
jgi:hypothetical protein